MNAVWQSLKAQQETVTDMPRRGGGNREEFCCGAGGQGNDTSRRQMLLVVIVMHSEETREANGTYSCRCELDGGGGGGTGTHVNEYSVGRTGCATGRHEHGGAGTVGLASRR
jgi:hypothetical protein